MEKLQDELGLLNDMVTAPTVIHNLELESHPDVESLMVAGNSEKLITAAQSSLDELMERKRFWRG
jgi:CHAD domain-containing protein